MHSWESSCFLHFYSVESVLSLLHLRFKGFKIGPRESRGGMQAASGSAEQETQGTGSRPLTPSPYPLPLSLSLFIVYGWLPDVRSACQTDWSGTAQALLLSSKHGVQM